MAQAFQLLTQLFSTCLELRPTKLRLHSFGFETIPYSMNVVRIPGGRCPEDAWHPNSLALEAGDMLDVSFEDTFTDEDGNEPLAI